uniref:ATP synthase complex subunit 8 n=1 Tax=Pleroneura sp. 1 GYN-2021b TaxID=2899767 RepID=A0A9E8Y9L2_9HYME|nr:ATP synthase F0 subunit 8 [Pleroneura sp. 1 GYN-2021b]
MPQMAPISWLIMFIMFFSLFIIFNIMNYFCYPLTPDKNNNFIKLNSPMMPWKW